MRRRRRLQRQTTGRCPAKRQIRVKGRLPLRLITRRRGRSTHRHRNMRRVHLLGRPINSQPVP
jgi:hypothetical protein